jgi:hypothetical protein
MTDNPTEKLPIHHIGVPWAACNRRLRADLRDDLGAERYRQLGVKERFKDEKPYRVCARCIATVSTSRYWRRKVGR